MMIPNLFDNLPPPSSALSPLDVVKIQLDALQNNDLLPNDAGIRFAFQYTSPQNRRSLGSLTDFIKLLKHEAFNQIIGFERAELETLYLDRRQARHDVHLFRKDDVVSFLFLVSRQVREPFDGLWLTDAVMPKC